MCREERDRSTNTVVGIVAMACAGLVGGSLVHLLPALPGTAFDVLLALLAALLWLRFPRWRVVAVLLLAVAWTAWRAAQVMDARLPRDMEGSDFDVIGTVAGLPDRRAEATTFDFVPSEARLDGLPQNLRGHIRIAWYGAPADAPLPCERWQLRVRLRRPRSMLDPGAFDGERQALQRRRSAVGYVRGDVDPLRIGRDAWCVDDMRSRLSAAIAASVGVSREAHLLQALAVGDTRGLEDADWDVARVTGVSHLLAISGFHVGVAAFGGVLAVRLLWWWLPWLSLRMPRQSMQALGAIVVGCAYGALAGWGLPTLRTLLMIAVAALALGTRRAVTGPQSLGLALLAILLADPLAPLAAGFWLSFAGVAFLMLGFARPRGVVAHARALGSAQWTMSIALLPLSVAFFGQAAPLGALANLIAVPVVSLLAVPLALLGVLAWLVSDVLAGVLWQLAAGVMQGLWSLLAAMAAWPGSAWYLPLPTWWSIALALVGAAWLLLPRGLPLRSVGVLLFLPLVWPATPSLSGGAFRADVLDVGQGLSVLLRTRHHALLYDAGPRYPSGFDVGAAAVLPALRAIGVQKLHALMISHGDADHAGGARVVARAYPHAARFGSNDPRVGLPLVQCRAGQRWTWDGVEFRVLHPSRGWDSPDNDGSCVLLVQGEGGRMLLTGDVSASVERLLADEMEAGPPLVLVVPHHGSKTASSEYFLRRIEPRMALVSSGWRNRYGHPATDVTARYAALRVPLLDTATSGAIGIDFPRSGPPELRWRWRMASRRYWRE